MTFHGGPVQIATTTYAIYWKPPGTFMDKGYPELMDQYLSDAGGSTIYGIGTAYPGSNGTPENSSTFGGAWTDASPYPDQFTAKALDAEIAKASAANNWPVGLASQFFLFTSRGALPGVNYCAYHTWFNLNHNKSTPVIYAFIPYTGFQNFCDPPYGITPNENRAADGSIDSVEHEQMEMLTDPLETAWYDDVNDEVADVCIYSFGFPFTRSGANYVVNRHLYFLQEIYNQTVGACQPNL
jgi:hypothetical protein